MAVNLINKLCGYSSYYKTPHLFNNFPSLYSLETPEVWGVGIQKKLLKAETGIQTMNRGCEQLVGQHERRWSLG
jgi:hypothetical protein